jgi:hypothetical protein
MRREQAQAPPNAFGAAYAAWERASPANGPPAHNQRASPPQPGLRSQICRGRTFPDIPSSRPGHVGAPPSAAQRVRAGPLGAQALGCARGSPERRRAQRLRAQPSAAQRLRAQRLRGERSAYVRSAAHESAGARLAAQRLSPARMRAQRSAAHPMSPARSAAQRLCPAARAAPKSGCARSAAQRNLGARNRCAAHATAPRPGAKPDRAVSPCATHARPGPILIAPFLPATRREKQLERNGGEFFSKSGPRGSRRASRYPVTRDQSFSREIG